jgi:hypothetical protein
VTVDLSQRRVSNVKTYWHFAIVVVIVANVAVVVVVVVIQIQLCDSWLISRQVSQVKTDWHCVKGFHWQL